MSRHAPPLSFTRLGLWEEGEREERGGKAALPRGDVDKMFGFPLINTCLPFPLHPPSP